MGNRENIYRPDSVSPPGDTLGEILEDIGMTQKELAERMDRPEKTINEIVRGKAAITPDTAIQLERVLNTPAHFWIQRESQYQESIARFKEQERLEQSIEWLKTVPLNQMVKYGWIKKSANKIEQLQEVLNFFGVASVQGWKSLWLSSEPKAAFRISLAYTNENAAIAAWLRHGEIKTKHSSLPEYDEKRFKENLWTIRDLTRKKEDCYKEEIKRLCNDAGVNVIFSPVLPKATISGAVRWVGNHPLIQLSLRGKYNDRFWFTFFHEAAHILLHGKKDFFLEGIEDKTSHKQKEDEADDYAANFLIPNERLNTFITQGDKSPNAIIRFANELSIHSGIVVGQLQNVNFLSYSYLNDMKTNLNIEMD
ncbi:HigA family addiction module antitoxin [Daejeonella sp.]|uniref:HigA family addiction module antitoxin n=1 Tax=Daejeonella sp. TaxID=2805397 RepID=UPI0030C000CF